MRRSREVSSPRTNRCDRSWQSALCEVARHKARGDASRRMGGAKRYPSAAAREAHGFRKGLKPSYALTMQPMHRRNQLHRKADEDEHQSQDAIEDRRVSNSAIRFSLFFLEKNYFCDRLRKTADALGQLLKLVEGVTRIIGYFIFRMITLVLSRMNPTTI